MMKRYRTHAVLLTVAGSLLASPALTAAQDGLPAAEQLIERHVEATGGRAALLGHTSSRTSGTFAMPAAGLEGRLVSEMAVPNLTYTSVEIPGLGTILSGYDGEVGWSVDPNMGARLLDGNELAATVEGSSQLAGVRDASLFDVRETVEMAEMNGQPCYKVRLVWKSGRETFDCYDSETGLLIGSIASQDTPMGAIEVTTYYENYRPTGRIVSPTRIRQSMMGMEQVMTIESVEFDVVEPDAFTPPPTIQALIEQRIDG